MPFEITEPAREALLAWLERRGRRPDDWLFPSRSRAGDHITTRQYGRRVDQWVGAVGLEPRAFGTQSLRRTKVAFRLEDVQRSRDGGDPPKDFEAGAVQHCGDFHCNEQLILRHEHAEA